MERTIITTRSPARVSTSGPASRIHRLTAAAVALAMIAQLLTMALAPGAALAANPTSTNNPPLAPHAIEVFPSRDFVSVSGYTIDQTVTIEVIHSALYGGGTISTASGLVPQDDPATPEFDGIVEVNHPGGYCWVGVTPDIRPGDVVRVTVDQTNIADATTVAGVSARRPTNPAPGTIVVTGVAADSNGSPIPLDQIEQRLVSPGNLFAANGRRTLRAAAPAADGTLAYDTVDNPTGTKWTATYSGLSAADVTRAMQAESRMLWLGANPLAAVEATLFEIGAGVVGGPAAPCTAPLEVLPPPPGSELVPPSTPTLLTAGVSNSNTVSLDWTDATDNVGVTAYGIYRNGVAIANLQNEDGSPNPPSTYQDMNVPPGTYVYTVDAADEVGNRSAQSNSLTAATVNQLAPATPGAEPPAGGRLFSAFPSRDFVGVEGYAPDDLVTILLIRNGIVISTAPATFPSDLDGTPGFDGFIEVNHPGGVCWAGVTPEIRAGDILRAIAYAPDGITVRSDDQITVANVTATMAELVTADNPLTAELEGTVKITGTAQDADGNPIPVDQLEQRLVSSTANSFEINGRRTLRADSAGVGEGTLAYDSVDNPTGTRWTATYSGLSFIDVARALSVESRIMWLGRDPLVGNELTLFETGLADPPGPSPAFCSSPLETPDTSAPSAPSLTVTPNGAARTVSLSWLPSSDDHYVYGYLITRDGQPLRYVGASVSSYVDTNVMPGPHTYVVQAFDSASPRGPGATSIDQLIAGMGERYGNLSSASNAESVVMPDVTAPGVPANLVAVAGLGQVSLSWSASADDVATTGYSVYRNGVLISTVAAPGFVVAEPVTGSFSYSVDAFDAAGNVSAQSPAVIANVTDVPDIIAPSLPTGVAATVPDLRARTIVVSWAASTDAVGVTGYTIYRDGLALSTVNGTTLSYTDANVPAETYSYTVVATDSAGNSSAQSDAASATVANDPPLAPISIIPFPSRDFVSASGYSDAEGPAVVSVYRNGALVSQSEPVPPLGGLVEVNHVDAGCWLTQTPDIRPGDLVRVTRASGVADQTVTMGVFAGRAIQTGPSTVTIHGVAIGLDGLPIPIGQLEHRLLSLGANFTLSGANTMRADAAGALEGSLSYDAVGSISWTATYSGLSAADVTRALNGESHVQWLGRTPLAGVEGTIFENGVDVVGGPEAGFCAAPLEGIVGLSGVSATAVNFNDVAAVPATTSAPRVVNLTNVGAAPLTIYGLYLAGPNAGDFNILSSTCGSSLASGASCTTQVTFAPTAMGARSASLNFLSTAANISNQLVALSGNGVDAAAPTTPGVPAQAIGAAVVANQLPLTISWAASTGAVTAYQLERSTNNGTTYTPVTLANPLATSTTLLLGTGANRFRVRACNVANCSAYATGANLNLNAVQQNGANTSIRGTWTNANLTGSYGGTVRFASLNTATHTYAPARVATTMQIAWIATRGPDRGRATVQIDGVNVATIDLYAPTVQPAQIVYTSAALAANRSHTMTIVVLGNRNPLSTGNRVDVDGFMTLR